MLESFINGAVLGFGVSVPFGPINVLILLYALKSFKNGFSLGLGAMSVDFLYLLLLNLGALAFLQNEFVQKAFAIFGFCFLSFLAFLMIKNKPKELNFNQEQRLESAYKSYAKGFTLNMANPYVIGFWLSTTLLMSKNSYPVLMFVGVVLAILTWIFTLSFFVSKFRHFITAKILFLINIVSALIIEYFAIFLLYKTFIG
ncbi:lysine transporter LysE [Campylobacter sp. MIT 99-7217]|uniref:LysE family transporter n=1 Tax=Campylobacter sp. MIT 99-7217 TaxID=535091 RepID=UPI0011577E84|nr:LysE family transporter [Campylobacter sp. MIT 99-7217]TQR33105.1 lysine transporter LysE [Campylobacter sp. MIT 99-7217]